MANREKQDMTAELAEGKILPLVFKLTIPAVIAQLITFFIISSTECTSRGSKAPAWTRWPRLGSYFPSR